MHQYISPNPLRVTVITEMTDRAFRFILYRQFSDESDREYIRSTFVIF